MINVRMRLQSRDSSYDIVIGHRLRSAITNIIADRRIAHVVVITDSNVGAIYGPLLRSARARASTRIDILTVPAGESSKTRSTKERLENRLIDLDADRNSVIVALGGGMIGDLAGFVAATYLRGIPYIQIPTSLLAQVDSSIGGKVAVDHPAGKNLIGAIYQPRKVYIDPSTLKTLPEMEYRNGLAEVVKYAVILDHAFFEFLERNKDAILARDARTVTSIVARCCRLKRSIVERDERETGLRRILNFGHTIGHAVEALSHFRIPHGRGVAIGMVAEASLAVHLGMLSASNAARITELVRAYHLPTELPHQFSIPDIVKETRRDKKRRDGVVQYTLPIGIGRARVGIPVPSREVARMLAA